MNYIIGATLMLVGAIIAYFASGQTTAGWIALYVLLIGWVFVGVYFAGIHKGKQNNDL